MGKIERLWLSTISTIKLYYSKKCKILYLTIVKTTAIIRKIRKKLHIRLLNRFFILQIVLKLFVLKPSFLS